MTYHALDVTRNYKGIVSLLKHTMTERQRYIKHSKKLRA